MSAGRRALITGITGQDGSYLADLLLEKGYDVFGVVRRASTESFERIAHLEGRVTLLQADLLDQASLQAALRESQPQEIYNLAAQSFVPTSWSQPVLTAEFTGVGVTRLLEAVREICPEARFYQASSSEMFGKVLEVPQTESTPFYPRSPYGVAKAYGHFITVNYRESYGLFAVSGILFNHESVPAHTPVAVRKNGLVDIVPIGDVIPHRTSPHSGTRYESDGGGYEVWDGEAWVRCTARTAYWYDGETTTLHGRGGVVESTPDHVVFTRDGEVAASAVEPGARLILGEPPPPTYATRMTEEEAWLLGFFAAEGYIAANGSGRLTCGDLEALDVAEQVWHQVTAGTSTLKHTTRSAFGSTVTPSLELRGANAYLRMIRPELYTRDGSKRIPLRILNAAPHLQLAFLEAYNLGDGLHAGNGSDRYRSFRTVSPTLAAGLTYLARTTLGRRVSMYLQPGALGGGSSYLINLSPGLTPGRKGAHLRKPQDEVRKVEASAYRGWMCDLATTTGRFAAGPGLAVVHNSPRRGLEFVTRKISDGAARIKLGLAEKLLLGNLDARRDWGFAGDYVRAMWLMMQHEKADDYVVATGQMHSVQDAVEICFGHVGLSWRDHVGTDPRYMRPAEVDQLLGDATKARDVLGWRPEVSFDQMMRDMVDADLARLSRPQPGS